MAVYSIVVQGELSDHFSSSFDGMTLHAADGETELVGNIVDQAQLQGVLSQLADLGLALVRVTQTGPEGSVGGIQPSR
jgi:arginine repressor